MTGCTIVNDFPTVRDAEDASSLRAALRDSDPGDYVRVTGRVRGQFVVPAGVIMSGLGGGELVVVDGLQGLDVRGSSDPGRPTTVTDLTITLEADQPAGIVARGGHVRIVDVQVNAGASTPAAIYLEDVDVADLRALRLFGDSVEGGLSSRDFGSGLVLLRVQDAVVSDVVAQFFGRVGVAIVDSTVRWDNGNASDIEEIGVLVHSSSVTLSNIEASRVRGRPDGAMNGFVLTGDADVRGQQLSASLCGNQGFLQVGGRSKIERLQVFANSWYGAQIQDAESVELSMLLSEQNFGAGLVATAVQRLRIIDSEVSRHARANIPVGGNTTATEPFGDGIEVIDSFSDLLLSGVRMAENWRVGLLLVGRGETLTRSMFEDVIISVGDDSSSFGVATVAVALGPNWTDGIFRGGALAARDETAGRLRNFAREPPSDFNFGFELQNQGFEALGAP